MNRQAITQMAKDFLLEYKGSDGAESPHAWPSIITQAANDVARRTECFYGFSTRSVTSGVYDYSPGNVFAPRNVTCLDGTGNIISLDHISADDLNIWGVVNGWVTATGTYAHGVPSQWIWLASNIIRILPVPNYNSGNGFVVEGPAYSSTQWPDLVDECPLPTEAHIAVAYRAAIIRTAQFPTADNKARAEQMSAIYETEVTYATTTIAMQSRQQSLVDTAPGYLGGL